MPCNEQKIMTGTLTKRRTTKTSNLRILLPAVQHMQDMVDDPPRSEGLHKARLRSKAVV